MVFEKNRKKQAAKRFLKENPAVIRLVNHDGKDIAIVTCHDRHGKKLWTRYFEIVTELDAKTMEPIHTEFLIPTVI